MAGKYRTAKAFRQALEDRLNRLASGREQDRVRLRREVAFERLLARFFASEDVPWVLKGGYGIEVRLRAKARSTQDIDLGVPDIRMFLSGGSFLPSLLFDRLQVVAEMDLGDWFGFDVGLATDDLEGAPYGGARFPVECLLDNRTFAMFHMDIGLGDQVVNPEMVTGHDLLSFAGVPPARMKMYSIDQQFSEKVHAFSQSRGERTNSRTRDLIDIVLIIQSGLLDSGKTAKAIGDTFGKRGTPVPGELSRPPAEWDDRYREMAGDIGLKTDDIEKGFQVFSDYWKKLQKHMGID